MFVLFYYWPIDKS